MNGFTIKENIQNTKQKNKEMTIWETGKGIWDEKVDLT